MKYALYADSAHYGARGCRSAIATGTRAEMDALKRRLRVADEAEGRYSTLYTVEPVA